MTDFQETIRQFFREGQWAFVEVEGQRILQMQYQGRNGRWTCYAQGLPEEDLFFFYSVCPVNTPEAQRPLMAEFVTRANYGLRIGNFEMDFSDGEVRFKTSLDVENAQLSPALIDNLVQANLTSMDRYLPGIYQVLFSGITPSEAIGAIEAA